jgi:hypothetical protein
MEELIATPADFWRNVQDPVSRIKDPVALFNLAIKAHDKFDNPHIRASALAIALHRLSEKRENISVPSGFDLDGNIKRSLESLESKSDFPSVRWYLSLNIAAATYYKVIGNTDIAISHLQMNLAKRDIAISHGQPFTNVVKSAGLLLALIKFNMDKLNPSEESLKSIFDQLHDVSNAITSNYKFTNEWAYEELALVFTYLYEITKCFYRAERKDIVPIKNSILSFNTKILPKMFND